MKYIFTFIIIIFYRGAVAQQVGSKVSFAAADGKTYTGTVTEVQGDKYKIKYNNFDFEAWLTASQFTVTDQGVQQPALPVQANVPTTIPDNTDQQMGQGNTTIPAQNDGGQINSPTGKTRSDSLKMALNNMKNAFSSINKLFVGKRDTMTILIPEIDYDNANLGRLKETIKKVKGVRSVVMHYNASTATMEVAYKGKPTDVWDNVPADVKTKFKLVEAGDNNITLKYKEKTP